MKIAYFDCPTGISGNMILGALLDAGLNKEFLKKELLKLQSLNFKIQNLQIQITKRKKHGIAGTYFQVKTKEKKKPRLLKDILTIIKTSQLSQKVKKLSANIFRRLAEAEAKVHNVSVNKVHFHEVGAVDALIDIVGTCIGMEKLRIEKIYCSPLPQGKGKIKTKHGFLPNPAPATAELLKGIPTYGTNIKGELVTPTGAAIISTLAKSFGDLPRMKVENIGYGAGTFNLPLPNLLRIFIGEAQIPAERDAVLQLETNLDDLNPKLYHRVIQKLLEAGALDAYLTPILMKKKRQAVNLIVLCAPEKKEEILKEIFTLTTTFGVRIYLVPREKLSRKFIQVKTKYGKAKVKLGFLAKELKTLAPEYEDYRKIAKKHHIPLTKAHREVIDSLFKKFYLFF